MKRLRRFAVISAVFLLAGTVLFAAGEKEQPEEPAEEPSRVLRVAASSQPGNLDPIFGGSPITTSMVMAAYETPVGYVTEDRGDFSVQVADDIEGWKPLLAEKVDISEDRKVLTFHLRGGVRFYPSGNEMTADDWIWAWERQLSDPPLGWGIFENQQASITDIDQITKVDEYTVRITLNEPNPLALPFMRFQMFAVYDSEEVRKHVTEEDPWAAEWLSKNTAGTGPYYVESWRPGERVVLERNPYYWGEPPAYETVEIHIVPEESTRLALLDRGDIMLTNDVSPELARRFGEKEGIDMYSIPSGNRVYIGFNVGRDPYSDRSLREGVAYAVPYGEILEDIYEGYGRRYRSFVLPELEGYTPEGFDYDTDLERAREHFESLGEPREVPTLFVNAGSVLEREAAAIIQDYLARADFPVEVRALPSGEFTSRLFAKDLPFFITSGVSWIDDPSTIAGLWMVSGAYGNFTGFSNPEVDRIQDEWQYRKPSPEREEAYREAQRLYNRAVNVVYLVLADHLVVQSDAVTNYTYYKDTATRYQDLRPGD